MTRPSLRRKLLALVAPAVMATTMLINAPAAHADPSQCVSTTIDLPFTYYGLLTTPIGWLLTQSPVTIATLYVVEPATSIVNACTAL